MSLQAQIAGIASTSVTVRLWLSSSSITEDQLA